MSLQSIRNFVQLTERIGISDQPTAEQFVFIVDQDYSTVINLAMSDHPGSIANEGEIGSAPGMTYIYLPAPFDAPQPAHIRGFCGLMGSL